MEALPWSKDEDDILRRHWQIKTDKELAIMLKHREPGAVHARRVRLKLRKKRRFTEAEDQKLIKMYTTYVPMRQIEKEFRRSKVTIIHRALKLGLHRDPRVAKLVSLHGTDILKNGFTYGAVMEEVRKKKPNMVSTKQQDGAIEKAIIELKDTLSQCTDDIEKRNAAIIKARSVGVHLKDLVAASGLGRETIRRIALNVSGASLLNLARKMAVLSDADYKKVLHLTAGLKREYKHVVPTSKT